MSTTAGQRSKRVITERYEVSLSDFEREIIRLESNPESINMLVYGDSNAGKTVLAGTTPGKTFWLVGEPGYKSAAARGHRAKARRIKDTATALTAIDWLNQDRRYEQLDWLIVDGVTTMENRFRFGYAAEAFDINPVKRQHRNLPDRPDYYNTQNFMKDWIAQLVDMPVNLLVTAHAFRTDKTENGELFVFPGFQGKVNEVSNAICGLMDCTGYLKVGKGGVRRSLWQRYTDPKTDVTYYAGDKFDRIPMLVDQPTMPKLLSYINRESED